MEFNGDNPVPHSNAQRQVIGPKFSFSSRDAGFAKGEPLTNHQVSPLGTADARSSSEKQPKISGFDLLSNQKREDFSNRAFIPQETKLKINSEGLNGHEYASPGRSASTSGKPFHVRETVKAASKVYLASAEHEIKLTASEASREGVNGSETSTGGEMQQQTMNNGEKLVKACPVMDMAKSTYENALISGKSFFRSSDGENQANSAVSGCDAAWKSTPLQNKVRRNGETLVSEMTVSSSCVDDRHFHLDSCKPWRKPLIDQIFITDVTSNFVTVTVKECLTDKGFFRQR